MSNVGQRIIEKIRLDIFSHLQKLPFTYYDSRPHGKILVRVVNYVNSLSDLLSNGLINIVTDSFSLIIIIFYMLFINVKLTLICMTGMPFLVVAVMIIKRIQRKAWQNQSRKQSNINAYIHESICGIKVTQSFSREDENMKIFRELGIDYKKAWMKAVKANFILWPIIDNISVAVVSLVFIAGVSWIGKGITVGVLIAFIGYIWRFWQPITNIGNFYNQIIIAIAYLERIFETIDEMPIVDDLKGAVEMPQIVGDVEFRNVTFSYDQGDVILNM